MNTGTFSFPPSPDVNRPTGLTQVFRRLVIVNNTGSPNDTLDVSADEILMKSEAGLYQLGLAVSGSVSIARSGAFGRDGLVEAASTWYYIWALGNELDTILILSASPTAPNLVAGYEYKALLGAVYNDAGSNFLRMVQADRQVGLAPQNIVGVGGTNLGLASAVPPIARIVRGYGVTVGAWAVAAESVNLIGASRFSDNASFELTLTIAQQLFIASPIAGAATLAVNGWTF